MSVEPRSIVVFADWIGLEAPRRLGTLSVHSVRGKEVISFEYDETWLSPRRRQARGEHSRRTRRALESHFPGKDDEFDSGAWEFLVAGLARDSGVEMSECRYDAFSRRGSTFLTKSFDRTGEGRIHFASGLTLLDRKDGDDAEAGASYLELAEFIMRSGSRPDLDLRRLWRRIVFSIAVSNTDDQLRNHGFLLDETGWRLSPAYDLNARPDSKGLSLAIDEHDNALDMALALSVAPHFRLSDQEARNIIDSIMGVVPTWRERARAQGISRNEIARMEAAFMKP